MLDVAVEELSQFVRFDAMLAGAGTRDADGAVVITQVLGCHQIAPAFIAEYPAVAGEDVVGQLFAAYPRIVQTISVDDYHALSERETGSVAGGRAGRMIANYLRKHGFEQLMLAGVDNSFGLAWITLYRHDADDAFTPADAEWAKHLVPGILYRWQRASCQRQGVELPSRLLPLTTREMQIAIMSAQGLLPKTIADRLDLSTSTVREVIQNIRARLGISGRKMTADDLERYIAAPPTKRQPPPIVLP
ncbi:helix-turn-helix transcriptional regulator [Massilia sp. CF038]|uniref:helix-turn-helix transcriptional regulator n=1 Tax=Massilia sp. CF038 TaxID=1881045 RepID=UPI00091184CC|nr:helix-turn-helix transcriptional regulator [Massilia sp. CF038]SHH06485.1 regulatory protein, luxR family [Massilia sp. CF038]